MVAQTELYSNFYSGNKKLRWFFRFDVRYRCRRLPEQLKKMGIKTEDKTILDFGFGSGALLKTFPKTCTIKGVDISSSAVRAAQNDEDFCMYKSSSFVQIGERNLKELPAGPYDVIVSSHSLEHVIDDDFVLDMFYKNLDADGCLCLFVPIEEPDYIRFHNRTYSLSTIQNLLRKHNFDIVFAEGSMHINGHIWKLLTIPSRRNWPVVGKIADGFRMFVLSLFPYKVIRFLDAFLDLLTFSPRQAFVVARKRKNLNEK